MRVRLVFLILLFILVLFPVSVFASSWAKSYGGPDLEVTSSIQQTSDGGFIVAGHEDLYGISEGNVAWMLKLNSTGNVAWNKFYDHALYGAGAYSIQQTLDGGFIVAGYTIVYDPVYPYTDCLVLKLNANGNITWQKTYDGSLWDEAHSVQQTSDGGFIVAGQTDYNHSRSIWVLRLDANGNDIWQKAWGGDIFGGSIYGGAYSIQQTLDGGFIVAGWAIDDIWVLKLNANGNVTWQKTYGGSGTAEVARSIQQTTDGGYIVAGYTDSYGAGRFDMWVLKLNANGNVTWQKTYGGPGTEAAYSIQQTTDSGYIVAGYTDSYGAGSSDMWVLKLNANGNVTWQKTYGGPDTEAAYSIQQTTDSGYIVAGSTNSYGAGGRDFWVLKLNANGNIPGCNLFQDTSVVPASSNVVPSNTSVTAMTAGLTVLDPLVGPVNTAATVDEQCFYDDPIATDLGYVPVSPCRIVDTRKSGGIIGAFKQRNFRVYGSGGEIGAQGGNDTGCSSPLDEPLAAHINMVAVDPTGKGNLQAFPMGAGPGAGLSVNYNAIDTNLANAGTVGTVTGAGPDITVTSRYSSAHTAIDVLGYYYPDGELLYFPVSPCRIVDTRKTSAGIINAFSERDFYVSGPSSITGPQGGNPDGCPSPTGMYFAAHINMVAVNPTGKGNLQAFPVGAGPGAGLSVNYNAIDTNLANAGTVKTNTSGPGKDITVTSQYSSAHTAIDVLGYYYSNGDLLYTPVTPCRIADTRKSGGIIGAFKQRNFRVYGSGGEIGAQGGNDTGCSSPLGEPLAAHINMVAVDPTGKGNLQAFPMGAGPGAGLSVNYNAIDTNLANAGTVGTVTGAGPDITVTSRYSSAHTAIDVLGYYYPAP